MYSLDSADLDRSLYGDNSSPHELDTGAGTVDDYDITGDPFNDGASNRWSSEDDGSAITADEGVGGRYSDRDDDDSDETLSDTQPVEAEPVQTQDLGHTALSGSDSYTDDSRDGADESTGDSEEQTPHQDEVQSPRETSSTDVRAQESHDVGSVVLNAEAEVAEDAGYPRGEMNDASAEADSPEPVAGHGDGPRGPIDPPDVRTARGMEEPDEGDETYGADQVRMALYWAVTTTVDNDMVIAEHLDGEQYVALDLYLKHDLTIAEIAARMGISEDEVVGLGNEIVTIGRELLGNVPGTIDPYQPAPAATEVREIAQDVQIKLSDLAAAAGVSATDLELFLSGELLLPAETVKQLLDHMEVPAGEAEAVMAQYARDFGATPNESAQVRDSQPQADQSSVTPHERPLIDPDHRWAKGEELAATKVALAVLKELEIDFTYPRQGALLKSIIALATAEPNITMEDMARRLEMGVQPIRTTLQTALPRMYAMVSADHRAELLQPTGPPVDREWDLTSVGGQVDSLRADAKVTVEKLASESKISESSLRVFLRGGTNLSIVKVRLVLENLEQSGLNPAKAQKLLVTYTANKAEAYQTRYGTPPPDPNSVGARVNDIRKTARLSVADVAEGIGVSPDALAGFYAGGANLSVPTFRNLLERSGLDSQAADGLVQEYREHMKNVKRQHYGDPQRDPEAVGVQADALRTEMRLSVADLALALRVTERHLWNFFEGRTTLDTKTVRRILADCGADEQTVMELAAKYDQQKDAKRPRTSK